MAEVLRTARPKSWGWLDELEAALGVNVRKAPTKTTSVNSDQVIFLFMGMLQNDRL
jgi:hypothetical protein